MIDPDIITVTLRGLVYVGSIGIAGSVLFALSFPQAMGPCRPTTRNQAVAGFCLLLVVEPLRYVVFQLEIAGGDWGLAFGPGLIWMGFETPIGQASAIRLLAATTILWVDLRFRAIGLVAALVVVGSFVLEGHTAAGDMRILLAVLLLVHLTAVHWWLGALFPLLALLHNAQPAMVITTIKAFSSRAMLVVSALLAAGVLLVVLLAGDNIRLDSAYLQRLAIKLVLVAGILAIATYNKLRLTPLLERDFPSAVARLRSAIRVEIAIALSILAATAWLVGVAPDT
jgi:putative copper export protein